MPTPLRSRPARARTSVAAVALAALVGLAGCDVTEDADTERGRALFQQKCGTCHALAQAGSGSLIGPDLDAAFAQARADGMDNDTIEGIVQAQIGNPRTVREDAPDYDQVFMQKDLVTGQDAEDVATYVGQVAGVPGAAPPELPANELFVEQCGSCHTLSAAGTSGTSGPDLDEVLAGQDAAYIEEQIVNPNSVITSGFSEGTMPADFGTRLTADDIQGLVEYVLDSVGQ